MPVISMFYGVIIRMFLWTIKSINCLMHIEYAEWQAVASIPDCELLAGDFPTKKLKLVNAWMEIHQDELMANWKLAVTGQPVFTIEALK